MDKLIEILQLIAEFFEKVWKIILGDDTPDPDPDLPWWWEWWLKPQSEWPRVVEGAVVAYVQVKEEVALRCWKRTNLQGYPIFQISQPPGEGTDVYRRTIVKPGKWLMVYPKGDGKTPPYYGATLRPVKGDSGVLCFHCMDENFADGKRFDQNPDRPLFVPVTAIGDFFEPSVSDVQEMYST